MALDLGGTNFRVLLIDIGEKKQFKMESKVFAIPKEIMIGTGDEVILIIIIAISTIMMSPNQMEKYVYFSSCLIT